MQFEILVEEDRMWSIELGRLHLPQETDRDREGQEMRRYLG